MLNMIFFQPFMFGTALAEQMGFNLVDSWDDFVVGNQIKKLIRFKVRNTDCKRIPVRKSDGAIRFFA